MLCWFFQKLTCFTGTLTCRHSFSNDSRNPKHHCFAFPEESLQIEPSTNGTGVSTGSIPNYKEVGVQRLSQEAALVYMGRIIVYGEEVPRAFETFEESVRAIRDEKCGLKMRTTKSKIFEKRFPFLRHDISEKVLEVTEEKVAANDKTKLPTKLKE